MYWLFSLAYLLTWKAGIYEPDTKGQSVCHVGHLITFNSCNSISIKTAHNKVNNRAWKDRCFSLIIYGHMALSCFYSMSLSLQAVGYLYWVAFKTDWRLQTQVVFMIFKVPQAWVYVLLAPSAERLHLWEALQVCICVCIFVWRGWSLMITQHVLAFASSCMCASVVFVWYVECGISVCNGWCCRDYPPCALKDWQFESLWPSC